jgi:hypothetical protein
MPDNAATVTKANSARALLKKVVGEMTFFGAARAFDDDDDSRFEFSPGDDCEVWIEILASQVIEMRRISDVRCGVRRYPYVMLVLKVPKNPEAKSFAKLAREATLRLQEPSELTRRGRPRNGVPRDPGDPR